MRTILIALAICPLAWADFIDTVVPSNVTLTQQLSGDNWNLYNWNQVTPTTWGGVTQTLAESTVVGSGNLGLWGFDEGACGLITAHNDIICVSGDVESAYWATSPQTGWQIFSRGSFSGGTCTNLGAMTTGTLGCLLLKAVWVVPNSSGNVFDNSACVAYNTIMTSLVASQTAGAPSYTGCNPVEYIANTTHTASSQPMFSAVTITRSSGTTADKAGNNLTIVAGREFQSCVDTTMLVSASPADTFLCAVNESRINGASGSTLYLGATLFQQVPVASIYSGSTVNLSRTTELPFTASYTGGGFGVLSNIPPITATTSTNGGIVQTGTGPFTYSVAVTGSPFLAGMVGSYIEESTNGSNSNQGLITGFVDANDITVALAVGQTAWNTSGVQALTVQPAPATNVGKFLAPHLGFVSASAMATWQWKSYLPAALQTAAHGVVLVWGSGALYGKGNLYFGAIDVDLIQSSAYTYTTVGATTTGGLNSMWYVTALSSGVPTWTQGAEDQAVAILTGWNHNQSGTSYTAECVNEHSVEWSPGINRWLLSYGFSGCGGLMVRTGLNPWGPFSGETQVMSNKVNATLNNTSGTANYWANNWNTLASYNNSGNQPGLTNFATTLPGNAPLTCASCQGGAATPALYENSTLGSTGLGGPWSNVGAGYGFRFYPGMEKINGNGSVTRSGFVSLLNPYSPVELIMNFSAPIAGSSISGAIKISGTAKIN